MAGKKHRRRGPRKLDLKKEREKVKFLSGLLAEHGAVQAELRDQFPPDSTDSIPEDFYQKCDQLRAINNQVLILNAMINNHIDKVIAVLVADQN